MDDNLRPVKGVILGLFLSSIIWFIILKMVM